MSIRFYYVNIVVMYAKKQFTYIIIFLLLFSITWQTVISGNDKEILGTEFSLEEDEFEDIAVREDQDLTEFDDERKARLRREHLLKRAEAQEKVDSIKKARRDKSTLTKERLLQHQRALAIKKARDRARKKAMLENKRRALGEKSILSQQHKQEIERKRLRALAIKKILARRKKLARKKRMLEKKNLAQSRKNTILKQKKLAQRKRAIMRILAKRKKLALKKSKDLVSTSSILPVAIITSDQKSPKSASAPVPVPVIESPIISPEPVAEPKPIIVTKDQSALAPIPTSAPEKKKKGGFWGLVTSNYDDLKKKILGPAKKPTSATITTKQSPKQKKIKRNLWNKVVDRVSSGYVKIKTKIKELTKRFLPSEKKK